MLELMPIHASPTTSFFVGEGSAKLLGLFDDGVFRARAALSGRGRCRRPQGRHPLAPRCRHRGDPRCRLQSYRGRQPPRADLVFRGIDNASYYKLSPDNARYYWDSTGTGNSLDLSQPRVLQMVLDSLRHWRAVYHVDGFRFDLASTLARDKFDVTAHAGFLRAIGQDPELQPRQADCRTLGRGQRRLSTRRLPAGWSEWNDRFRDTYALSGAAIPESCRSSHA